MATKARSSVSLRRWPKNQERLDRAAKGSLNVSEIVNRILDKYLDDEIDAALRQRKKEIEAVMSAPIP